MASDGFALTSDDGFELVDDAEGRVVDGSCAASSGCCSNCRTYYKLFACTVNTPTVCGIVPVEPPSIYLWSGAKCGLGLGGAGQAEVQPGDVVFLNGRCWRIGAGLFNDRNGVGSACPEPRVPENATVFEDEFVQCIAQGCEAQVCQDALEGFVQALPCGLIQGEQVIQYTCRAFLSRCFVTKLLANPNDPESDVCYKFDPAGPAVNPALLPPTAVFHSFAAITDMLASDPPDTCCACEVAIRSPVQVIDGQCDRGIGRNTRQTLVGVADLGDIECCCGRTEDWENAQITLGNWSEEQFFDTGSNTFLTRVSLDAPLIFRNGDAVNGIDVPLVQRDYQNGIQTGQSTITIRIFFQQCGLLIIEDFGSLPAFGFNSDFVERRQSCRTGSYRHQFGPPESRFTKSWTITAQFPEARVPCAGGCSGRIKPKGGVGGPVNTGGGSSGTIDQPLAFGFL